MHVYPHQVDWGIQSSVDGDNNISPICVFLYEGCFCFFQWIDFGYYDYSCEGSGEVLIMVYCGLNLIHGPQFSLHEVDLLFGVCSGFCED